MKLPSSSWLLAVAFASLLSSVGFANDEGEAQYLRVIDRPNELLSLEIASIDMVPATEAVGPRIGLIGVAHVGDAVFYAEIQQLLDTYEIVLFEAIQPTSAGREFGDSREDRVQATEESMRFVAAVAEAFKIERERYADDLDELRQFTRDTEPILYNWFSRALTDAWGDPLTYRHDPDSASFGIHSRGGGDAIAFDDHDAVVALDFEADNLQQQLADALSLEFQLRSLTYDAANWRPSDMSMNELNAAFASEGVDVALVEGTLGGATFPARLIGGLLRIVGVLDAMSQGAVSDMMKVMMIEMLGNETTLEMSMSQLGDGFATVILDLRNQVVIDDLAYILRDEPEITSIAVLYGAAHLPDLVKRMEDQLGYERDATQWFRAITVDLRESQMDARQVQRMRMMVQRMMEQQMRQLSPPRSPTGKDQ